MKPAITVANLEILTEGNQTENGQAASPLLLEQVAREEAERATTQFRAIFESIPGLFLVINPKDLRIFAASDAYLHATGTQRDKILGMPIFEVFPADPNDPSSGKSVEMAKRSFDRVKQTGKPDVLAVQRYSVRRLPELGGGFEERYWTVANFPVFTPDHELAYIIHRVEDVTEYVHLKQREGSWQEGVFTIQDKEARMEAEVVMRTEELHRVNERLRQREIQLQGVNNELSEFATIVAHDLKAPLRAVATLAKWTQMDASDKLDPEAKTNLEEIMKRVHRMNRMIEGLLRYAHIGGADEKSEAVALGPLLEELWQDLAPPENASLQLQAGLPVVPGDPLRLRQLFQNLLANSLKYSDKPQVQIQVNATEREASWEFVVADNGLGIEEKHWERIFKIFQTLAPKDQSDSTGVGLALVKRIVERAGGHVWVNSTLGVGSRFFFTWPKLPFATECVLSPPGGPTRNLLEQPSAGRLPSS